VPRIKYDDKVWLNEDCKLRGIGDELEGAFIQHQAALLIAFFEDTLAQLENALQARTILYRHYSTLYPLTLCEVEPGTLITALAQDLQGNNDLTADSDRHGSSLLVVIAEHHPLSTREQDLLRAVAALPCAGPIGFHCALTDPLMVRFGSETIQRLFKQLGIDEQMPLSHALMSSALQKAQAKIGQKVQTEMSAHSAEAWFQLNLPDGNQ